MADENERIARLESRSDAHKEKLADQENRIRRLERVYIGVIVVAAVLGWVITQANSLMKIFGE